MKWQSYEKAMQQLYDVDDRHEVDSDCDSDQTLGADNLNINNNWETTIEWILVGHNMLHCSSVGAHEQSTY